MGKLIKCSLCSYKHAPPDCKDRQFIRGPAGKCPMPPGGCCKCWYGFGEHTYVRDCELNPRNYDDAE